MEGSESASSAMSSGGGGGGGLFSLSGTDWLGIGRNGEALAKGTERCGSRPNCIAWTKSCKQSREAYNKCVTETSSQDYELAKMALNNDARKNAPAEPAISPKMIIIGIVVLVAIVLLIKK